jgi:ketosteroid isomerase-like protein
MTETITARDPEVQALVDKQAILEVLTRYCRGLDRGDAALIASAYHPDAVDDHGGKTFSGEGLAQGILDWMQEIHVVMGSHYTDNQTIHLDGDRAWVESYFSGYMLQSNDGQESTLQMSGRYLDRLERRDGEWKIAARQVIPEMTRTLLTDTFWLGRRLSHDDDDRADPSYAFLAGE